MRRSPAIRPPRAPRRKRKKRPKKKSNTAYRRRLDHNPARTPPNHMADPIRITTADLQRPEINDYVEMQSYLQRDVGEIGRQPWLIRVIYANWFYLSIAAALGGFVAWAGLEPWYENLGE